MGSSSHQLGELERADRTRYCPGHHPERSAPRLEQFIRAQRAAELGLVAFLPDAPDRDPRTMAAALLQLTQQKRPSAVVIPGLLDGMASVNRLAQKWLNQGRAERMRVRAQRNA